MLATSILARLRLGWGSFETFLELPRLFLTASWKSVQSEDEGACFALNGGFVRADEHNADNLGVKRQRDRLRGGEGSSGGPDGEPVPDDADAQVGDGEDP